MMVGLLRVGSSKEAVISIKFIPQDKGVTLEGQTPHEKELINLLKATINGLHRVEKQLEKLTDEEIDCDDGSIF